LNKLPEVMKEVQDDISNFNIEVQNILIAFNARGLGVPSGLLTHLFDGYEACADREFVAYITRKKDLLTEGVVVQPRDLMSMALNKFKQLKEDDRWKQDTADQKSIIALSAKLESTVKQYNDFKKKVVVKVDPKKTGTRRTRGGKRNTTTTTPAAGGTVRKKFVPPRWMTENPQNRAQLTREGKTYNWCPHHKRWVKHLPTDCTLDPNHVPSNSTPNNNKAPTVEPQMQLDHNLSAIVEVENEMDL
jgi:hypothetical protein